jgi:hypothetical protein
LRQAARALAAWRRERYDQISYVLCWLVNSQPTFSKQQRSTIPLWRFNRMARRPKQTQMEKDAAFDALWAIAEDPPVC